mmetsp:Transcript_39720/g.77755  ORF Transcript_39720/g.77755 Transcript_39720/m.77755 type:complete len:150 (-) Transcript_39720:191-640(-)|eukprot:CAMPEP_0173407250 /NCGR_PEP_ID=MMETSP1356-20130122/66637_1 /TAXON_ID=77927 ORGANISM="Hemiselmis virescens, Strain PCC157" /NCGR_SAMPLE_ID=MMETSP1356 /ASSEMBLY_ACC=CAM_ASM_000847 /LENGTH=149 /DNA_ID=CAMNT_0014368389 /DNA_START=173 /DNA_END=622 /DNA_ORIENTATION=-
MAAWWDDSVTAVKELLGLPDAAITCCTSVQRPDEPMSNRQGHCGVGMILCDCEQPTYNNHNVFVKTLSPGGPADNSKQIQRGDTLLKIDGKDVVGLRTADLGDMLLGPGESAVSLTLKRGPAWQGGEGKTYHVDLRRSWASAGLKEVPN